MPSLMKARSGVLNSNIGGNALAPLFSTGALTIANAITDVTRLAGVEGDGATYPASMAGVWPAATNQILNGNCTTNTTNIDANSGTTLARSTSRYKFGATSLEITCPGLTNSEGANFRSGAGTAAAGEVKSAGIWVYHEASGPLNIYCQIAWRDSGGSALTPSTGTITAVSPFVWTQLTATGTAPASTDRADVKAIKSSISIDSFWAGGIQLETGSIATPYIHTDGGTASRSAGTVEGIPAACLDETQAWLHMRVRMGTASSSGLTLALFEMRDDNNNRIIVYKPAGFERIDIYRIGGGADGRSSSYNLTWAVGDVLSVTAAWSSSGVSISANGGTLNGPYSGSIPVLTESLHRFGNLEADATASLRGSIFWAAIGKGTLTSADAVLFNSWGNNRPLPHQFPRSADLRFLAHFYGDGTQYRYRAA